MVRWPQWLFDLVRNLAGIARGLRFRLTVSYVLLFFVLLMAIGLLFRQNLRSQTESEVRTTLEEEWAAAKGYLVIQNERPIWQYDNTDPEEARIVDRLRLVHLLTDADGNVLTDSSTYEALGIDSPEEVHRILKLKSPEIHVKTDAQGVPYLIKAGVLPDVHRKPYFFAIGRSLESSRSTVRNFTRAYFLLLPLMLLVTGVLGWFLAGRAIEPVNSVAQAAANVHGSNLTLKIPRRGANDELDRLIDNFNRMTERLHRSFDQIQRFSTDVSHELRTPLTAIRGQLEVALFTADTPEQYREAIANALEAVEQLSSIVRALLLLSQAESGQLVLQRSILDLGKVALDIVDQFQIPAEEKQLQITADAAPGVIIPADRTQVERMISNLLSNAVKYTPFRGRIQVRISRDAGTGWARLEVEDTGAGIPPEDLPHIFDRFYRVRNPETNKIEGLGLGLSFVSLIVGAHGGRVDVASRLGQGTRFTVLLPPETSAPPAPARIEEAALS
jgi:heavy metal sensor kinase